MRDEDSVDCRDAETVSVRVVDRQVFADKEAVNILASQPVRVVVDSDEDVSFIAAHSTIAEIGVGKGVHALCFTYRDNGRFPVGVADNVVFFVEVGRTTDR